jgi:hypothetical protein
MRIDQDNYTALKEHLVVTLERFQRAAAGTQTVMAFISSVGRRSSISNFFLTLGRSPGIRQAEFGAWRVDYGLRSEALEEGSDHGKIGVDLRWCS